MSEDFVNLIGRPGCRVGRCRRILNVYSAWIPTFRCKQTVGIERVNKVENLLDHLRSQSCLPMSVDTCMTCYEGSIRRSTPLMKVVT